MPLPTTFAGASARGEGLFNAKIAYTAPTINTSGVITSMATGATSGGNVSASGGSGVYSYSVYSGSLPYNLTLNTSTGYITGTLQAGGTFNVVFNVTDTVSGLSTQSGTVTINTTYSEVYAYSPSMPSGGTYTDLESMSLSLSGITHNSFFASSGLSTTAGQMCTDSYGRIFVTVPPLGGSGVNGSIQIWSNGSSSQIYNGSYAVSGGCCLGSDGNVYASYIQPSTSYPVIIKFTPSLTQTTYIYSYALDNIIQMCSDGSSKIYTVSNTYGLRYFDISADTFYNTTIVSVSNAGPYITYGGDGNLYSPGTYDTGSRTGRRTVLSLRQITTSGTVTTYVLHDPGGGNGDASGAVCSTTISGTPYIVTGGNNNSSSTPCIAGFNTSTNAVTVSNFGSSNGNVYGISAHTNGSVYAASTQGSVAKWNSGTITSSFSGTLSYQKIVPGP